MNIIREKRRLQGKTIENLELSGADLSHSRGFQSNWFGCKFLDCRFDLSELGAAHFTNTYFDRCTFGLSSMGPTRYEGCTFDACNLDNATFQGSWITDTWFSRCRAQYANFDGCQLERTVFRDSNFRWANLTFASSEEVSWENTTLWGARVAFDCAFFRGHFDEKWRRRFGALLAFAWPESPEKATLEKLAGPHMEAIRRLMEGGTDGEHT